MVYGKQTHDTIESTPRKDSLSTKLLISVILWVVSILIITSYALAFLWQLERGGIAINNGGSLRMRVYHMVALIERPKNQIQLKQEITTFNQILENLQTTDRSSLFLPKSFKIENQIQLISQQWNGYILPLITKYSNLKQAIPSQQLKQIDFFVNEVDKLVKLIELENTQHISWLRFIQTVLIIVVIFFAFTAIYLLYRLVIRPLSVIQDGIMQLSHGNLSKRIVLNKKDEFGTVSAGFNEMASNLEDFYSNLEQKVNEKTAALEEKNHELSSLYDITAFLHESHAQEVMTRDFLKHIITITHANAGSIRLIDKNNNRLNYIASQGLPDELLTTPKCSSINGCYCGIEASKEKSKIQILDLTHSISANNYCIKNLFMQCMNFQIKHNNNIGVMTLYYKDNKTQLSPQTTYLIEALTDQLAVALENQQLVLSDKQLAVMEERNLMAQGLHDSIAQSLSFLNLQVQMLQNALATNETKQIEKNTNFIQQGIQECYEDVRELLLNFRIRIDKEDFKEVVEDLLDRFKTQTKIMVELTRTGDGPSLKPEQQLQAIFILQEALSNIRKHAKCSLVKINIIYDEYFQLSIADNGCGFHKLEVDRKKTNHVGLSIMSERAALILADIEIHSVLNLGTTITLTIPKEQRGIL